MKTVIKIAAVLILLLIIAIVVLSLSLNSLLKTGVETVGPTLTGTTVTVEDIDLSPLAGRARLQEMVIGNPQGFHTPHAFKLGNVQVRVDPGSALSDTLVIHEVLIDGPEVTFEGSLSQSNIGKIREHVETVSGTGRQDSPKGQPRPEPSSGGRKVLIDDFIVKNGRVNLSASILQGEVVSIPLPDIHLRNIGRQSGGATLKEVALQVIPALEKATIQAVASSGDLVGKGLKQLDKSLKNLGRSPEEAASKVLDGVKGLLGGK